MSVYHYYSNQKIQTLVVRVTYRESGGSSGMLTVENKLYY